MKIILKMIKILKKWSLEIIKINDEIVQFVLEGVARKIKFNNKIIEFILRIIPIFIGFIGAWGLIIFWEFCFVLNSLLDYLLTFCYDMYGIYRLTKSFHEFIYVICYLLYWGTYFNFKKLINNINAVLNRVPRKYWKYIIFYIILLTIVIILQQPHMAVTSEFIE